MARVKKTGLRTSDSELDTAYVIVALFNGRSLCNKALQVNEHLVEHKWNAIAITETSLRKTIDEAVVSDVNPHGYLFQHVTRSPRRGRGVAILRRDTLCCKKN